jgi:hypothetical protein
LGYIDPDIVKAEQIAIEEQERKRTRTREKADEALESSHDSGLGR